MFISVILMVATAIPSSVAVRPVHTARHMLQAEESAAIVTAPVDVSAAPPGDVIKLSKSTIELALGEWGSFHAAAEVYVCGAGVI